MQTARRSHGDRRAFAALAAMFALLIQTLLPAAALASSAGSDGLAVICTATGTATVHSDDAAPRPAKGFAGMPCQDCLAAAMAVVQAPGLAVRPVVYAVGRIEHEADPQQITPRARAPPRPLGQGPPSS